MELVYLVLASVAIMCASLVGVVFVNKKLGHWTEKNIQYLVAFSAGVFLVVAYDLIFEAFEFGSNKLITTVSIIAGFLVFYLFEKYYPETHCHHGDGACQVTKNKKGANRVLYGDAFHNFGDGILLAPVFVTDIRVGFIAAFGILAHELVQEISEFFVLKSAGYSNKEALIKNFLSSSTILVGAIGGYYLTSFEYLVGPLIGLAGGAFVYILIIDLIPESVKHSHREKKYINYLAWALLGVFVILLVNISIESNMKKEGLDGHGHAEEVGHTH